MAFSHLHVHDTYSLLDGYGLPQVLAARSMELGMVSLGQTNHGTISGHIAHKKACEANGIHPVFGCEYYIVPDMKRRGLTAEEESDIKLKAGSKAEREKLRKETLKSASERSHIVAFAMNDEGYSNLRTLVSLSHLEGFYRKPRIDYVTLLKHSNGLYITSACMAGDIPKAILAGEIAGAQGLALELMKGTNNNFALEIMPFDMEAQRKINLGIQQISNATGIPVIATNDTHYIRERDSWAHEVLLAIGTGKTFDDENRFRFGNGELFMRSEDQMLSAFQRHHPELSPDFVKKALNFAYDLSFQLKADPLKSVAELPTFPIPENKPADKKEFLRYLCGLGWRRRGCEAFLKEVQQEYGRRITAELYILNSKGFEDYFFIVQDMVNWAKDQGIAVGPARGSVAGSLVAYLLGITDIDPIRFDLSFERFIAPHRNDYPDIDVDFEDRRRWEVRKYLEDKYGEDCVANVATFNKLGFRSAFRDAARIFKVPQYEVNQAIGYFENEAPDEEDDDQGFNHVSEFATKHPNVIKATKALIGQLRTGSVHAAGIVLASKPLKEVTAIQVRDGKPVVELTKDEAEALGLVKIDLLGLKTMSVIAYALERVNAKRLENDQDKIELVALTTSLNDPVVFKEFALGNTEAVFQFNKPGGKRLCMDTEVSCFEDLVAVNALDRPGPLQSGGTDIYIKNKRSRTVGTIHPVFEKVTKNTFGVLLYQEQVMALCGEFAGLDWPEIHAIRKAIAKSHGAEALEEFWNIFRNGVLDHGMAKEATARRIWDNIVTFGGYGFNRSHAVAYAAIGYATMWLKIYYPAEYLCGHMIYGTDPKEAVLEARARGVKIYEPDINKSGPDYTLSKGEVYAGLTAIKGIGDAAANVIIEARRKGKFKDIEDFETRTKSRQVHKGIIRSFIQAGAFDSIHKNPEALLAYLEYLEKTKGKLDLFGEETKEMREETTKKKKPSVEFLMKRMALLPFIPQKHPALEFGDVLKKLDKLYPKRTTIAELRMAGRANTRNETRTITGILTKFEIKRGDYGSKQKVGLVWIEDETGEIVVRMDIRRFPFEIQQYDGQQGGIPLIAVVSPISEHRADVREIGDLLKFRKAITNPEKLYESMEHMLKAPGRVVIPHRQTQKTLKRAVRMKQPTILVLIMRIWSGNSKKGEMGFVDVADETGQQIILIWPRSWALLQDQLKEGKIYEASLGVLKDKTLHCDTDRGHKFREVASVQEPEEEE